MTHSTKTQPQEQAINVVIGPLHIRVTSCHSELLALTAVALREYLCEHVSSEYHIILRPMEDQAQKDGYQLLNSARSGVNDRPGRQVEVKVQVDLNNINIGRLRRRCLPGGLYFAFRDVLIDWLAQRGGFILHSSAFPVNDRAIVAFGASGSGKTTLASLAGAALSDELTICFPSTDGWRVAGAPFPERFPGKIVPGSIRIAGFCVPARGEVPSIVPLTPRTSAQSLMKQVVLGTSQALVAQPVLSSIQALVRCLPFFRFEFSPDCSAMPALSRFIEKNY